MENCFFNLDLTMFTQIIFSSLHASLPLNLNRTFKGAIVEHVVVCLPCFLKKSKKPNPTLPPPKYVIYTCIYVLVYALIDYISMCVCIYICTSTYLYLFKSYIRTRSFTKLLSCS